jgi:hypothetical protein
MPNFFLKNQVNQEAEGGEESEGEGGEEGANEGGEEGGAEQRHEVEGVAEEDETPFVAASVVDEGEHNSKVLSQYEMEIEGDERALEEDSTNDEDDGHDEHVPRDWQNYDFSRLTINVGENVSWECRENEVLVGAMYPTSEHLKDVVKRWAICYPLRCLPIKAPLPLGASLS